MLSVVVRTPDWKLCQPSLTVELTIGAFPPARSPAGHCRRAQSKNGAR